jgi:FkbM family methyltransferase
MSDALRRLADLSPEKRLLLAKRLSASAPAEAIGAEPVAVVGMACRFPGCAHDPDAYWRMLESGVDGIREVPKDRWDIDAYHDPDPEAPGKISSRWGGFLDHIDEIDAAFFGIGPREAGAMDPQQRLLLEATWEALEDAGLTRERLSGSRTGVFFGVISSDYMLLSLSDAQRIDAYAGTGVSNSVATGRVSHHLDLRGPSVTIDTACSASLVAVHLACQSLRARESTAAIAGGVSVMASPLISVAASKLSSSLVAQDGRCKAFDARADGLVRGEGCGVVVLKLLSDALADGDTILALIRGSAVNHDGRSVGLTAPNVLAQTDVMQQALRAAGVRAEQVSYVEAHGTGTALGDPIEAEALVNVYGRASGEPCAVASVKTNFGHLEGAAGVAGLIKVILSLGRAKLAPHLHFRSLSPSISFEGTRLFIPTELRPWEAPSGGRRFGAVSSFGWSGTNAHVVLEEAPRTAPREPEPEERGTDSLVLPISARSALALRALLEAYRALSKAPDRPSLADVCYSASLRRTHHEHRIAFVARSWDDLGQQIEAALEKPAPAAAARASARASEEVEERSPEGFARRYQLGQTVDWAALYPKGGRFVRLPRYPFQRKRFWISPPATSEKLSAKVDAPPQLIALSGSFCSALQPQTRLWDAAIDVRGLSAPFVASDGFGLSPLALGVEVALAASEQAFPGALIELLEGELEDGACASKDRLKMQAAITESSGGPAEVLVFSALELPTGGVFARYFRAFVRRGTSAPRRELPAGPASERLADAAAIAGSEHNQIANRFGLSREADLITLTASRREQGRLLVRVDASRLAQRRSPLRPYLLDLGLRALLLLVSKEGRALLGALAPSALGLRYARAEGLAEGSTTFWIDAARSPSGLEGDIAVLDERGAVVLELGAAFLALPSEEPTEEAPKRLATLPNGMEIAYQSRAELDHFYSDIFEKKIYLQHGISLRDGDCVFDVGANIGLFSLFVSQAYPSAALFSFEPAPPLHAIARYNLARYNADAFVFDFGLSNAEGTASFTFYPNSSGMSSFHADEAEERSALRAVFQAELRRGAPGLEQLLKHEEDLLEQRLKRETFTCRLRTLSDVIQETGVECVDLVKIDVQKCELEVLEGVREEHWPLLRQLVVEVHNIEGRVAKIRALLEDRGFAVLAEQDESYEGSIMVNLFAVRPPGRDPLADRPRRRPAWLASHRPSPPEEPSEARAVSRAPLIERASQRAAMQRLSIEKQRAARKRTP